MVTFSVSIFTPSNVLKVRPGFPNLIGRYFLELKEHNKLRTIPTKSREVHHNWSMSHCCTRSIPSEDGVIKEICKMAYSINVQES